MRKIISQLARCCHVTTLLTGPSNKQKLILDHLYNLRDTRMDPPDDRLSVKGIATALGLGTRETRKELLELARMARVRPVRVRRFAYYKLTLFSLKELESVQEKSLEAEISTSKIGIALGKKSKSSGRAGESGSVV